MSKEPTKVGYAVSYIDISGKPALSIVSTSVALAKANHLNKYYHNIDSTWTPSRVEEAWKSWLIINEAEVLEIYTKEVES